MHILFYLICQYSNIVLEPQVIILYLTTLVPEWGGYITSTFCTYLPVINHTLLIWCGVLGDFLFYDGGTLYILATFNF